VRQQIPAPTKCAFDLAVRKIRDGITGSLGVFHGRALAASTEQYLRRIPGFCIGTVSKERSSSTFQSGAFLGFTKFECVDNCHRNFAFTKIARHRLARILSDAVRSRIIHQLKCHSRLRPYCERFSSCSECPPRMAPISCKLKTGKRSCDRSDQSVLPAKSACPAFPSGEARLLPSAASVRSGIENTEVALL